MKLWIFRTSGIHL